ncbi:NAD-dependent epimerase/dehydratase family protein [Spongiactinospora sp. TRM90649]|uniref:NAD-dependent epimerase/dehydratase family protein n=1 Tax=Spongiactinospora sp. TRM90649 TaxID=3031114 RepID=UPI0023F8AAD2|nr:NAD-dependent epimerase/dehydratase family protein [Spongiactinospora sp. TRM90649]MDF5752902.1 NAD-dependent epimerase/dehydratase family protein [Spongiactinospora sp. TRM90649]
MRVVVVGGTGNVGTSVVAALAADPQVTSVLGLARRMPSWRPAKVEWSRADVSADDLMPAFEGADAVVNLAWLFQPTRDPVLTWRNNVLGAIRVFGAAADARVPVLVHASSVGAYSPGPKDRPVSETYPTHGWPRAAYSREKSYLERVLDTFELKHPDIRVVRMRPAFIFKREASAEQRRLFAGPFVPQRLARPELIPIVPDAPGLVFQAVHGDDVGEAYRLAVTKDVSGAFNLAADPVVDPAVLADLLGAKTVPVPGFMLTGLVAAIWRLRLVPASPGLVDLVLKLPVMDVARAHHVLGWRPRHSAVDALRAFASGLRDRDGMDTPPLAPPSGGRAGEVTSGVGGAP